MIVLAILFVLALAALLWSIPTFGATVPTQINITQAQTAPTGVPPVSGALQFGLSTTYKQGTGAGLCNEAYVLFESIAASGNVSLDLTTLTDVCGQAVALARVKAFGIYLLSAGQTAADGSTAGSACSSITVEGGASNPWVGPLAGTTPTYTINSGGCWEHTDPGATGIIVDGTHKSLKITNNDAGVAAKVQIILLGADA